MAIVPIIRCAGIRVAIEFYTTILDFELMDGDPSESDPSFAILGRADDVLFLSSHRGDGEFGQAVAVLVDDVDALFQRFRARGLQTPGDATSPVHERPTNQSWGTREFYVDDPDGNTLRFIQGFTVSEA